MGDYFLNDLLSQDYANSYEEESEASEIPERLERCVTGPDKIRKYGLSILANHLEKDPVLTRTLLFPKDRRSGLGEAWNIIQKQMPDLRGNSSTLCRILKEFDKFEETGTRGCEGFRRLVEIKKQYQHFGNDMLPQKRPSPAAAATATAAARPAEPAAPKPPPQPQPQQPQAQPQPQKRKMTFNVTGDVTIDLDPMAKKISIMWE